VPKIPTFPNFLINPHDRLDFYILICPLKLLFLPTIFFSLGISFSSFFLTNFTLVLFISLNRCLDRDVVSPFCFLFYLFWQQFSKAFPSHFVNLFFDIYLSSSPRTLCPGRAVTGASPSHCTETSRAFTFVLCFYPESSKRGWLCTNPQRSRSPLANLLRPPPFSDWFYGPPAGGPLPNYRLKQL